jgi:type IV pilus assembly protein PilV
MMNALSNKKGFTLVELMIAMSIILIMFLSLLMTSLLSSTTNMQNIIRDEAIQMADMKLIELRNVTFDNLPAEAGVETSADNPDLQRTVRNFNVDFTSTVAVEDLPAVNPLARQINVTIAWMYKGENYTHAVATIQRRL